MNELVIPSECILLRSAFNNISKDKLPKSSKALTLIGEEFVNYLIQAFDNKSPQINYMYQALSNQKEKNKILTLMKEKSSFSTREEFAFTFINFCLLDELKVYQKANEISSLSKKEVLLNYTKLTYYIKLSWLDLTGEDKDLLEASKAEVLIELLKLIDLNNLLLYENFKENNFDNLKQITLDKFQTYIENCLYIDFTEENNIKISFENIDNDIIIYPAPGKKYIKLGKRIKFNKSSKSQSRLLRIVNNIYRRIAKQERKVKLIAAYQSSLQELELLNTLSLNASFSNLSDQKQKLEEYIQRLSFELNYLGITKESEVINKSLQKIERVVARLERKLKTVLDLQIKYNISGLSSTPISKDVYGVEEGLTVTKDDIYKLSKQKDKVLEYWLVVAAGKTIYYRDSELENITQVQYKELIKIVDNAHWIEPFATKDFIVLFIFNKNAKRVADLSKNSYYICFANEDRLK